MLYIRHGEKMYENGQSTTFSLDPELTNEGKKDAWIKFYRILQDFGVPDKIISSPYLRARETAEIAQAVIFSVFNITVPIFIDPIVGEYLGHQVGKDLNKNLREETLIYNPIPAETWNGFIYRLRCHQQISEENVWYITHGVVIKMIAFLNGQKISRPQPVDGIFLSQKDIPKKIKKSSIQFVSFKK